MALGVVAASLFFSARGIPAATVQYVYDELGRLIAAIDPAADVTEYTYDEVGNLLSVSRRSSSQVSIISFAPRRGLAGQAVTIVGTAFSANAAQNQVQFNGTAAVVMSATLTSLVSSVPSGATTGPISVTTPSGTATTATAFVVREAPQIASFSPAVGTPNSTLTLTGRGLDEPDLSVVVNTTASQVISATPATLTSRIPTATGGKISVTTSLGTATTVDDIFIVPVPHAVADVAATGRIAVDGQGQVVALPAAKVGLLLFDGVAGSSVRLSLTAVTLPLGTLSAFRPDGVPLAAAISFGAAGASVLLSSLPTNGTYGVLVVADTAASGTVTIAASTSTGIPTLSYGETIVTSIVAGQPGSFTFNGTAGESVGLEVKGVTLPNGGVATVLRPDGGFFASVPFTPTSDLSQRLGILPLTGTYTVQVNGSGTGSVQFTLWKDVDGALELGIPRTITTTFRNQQARLTFTGTINQPGLGVDIANAGFGGTVQVLGSNFNQTSVVTFTAPAGVGLRTGILGGSGTYTVVIIPTGSSTGSAQVTLWNDVSGTLAVGVQNNLTVAFRNQQIRMTFTGTLGQPGLGVDIANAGFGGTVQVLGSNFNQTSVVTFTAPAGVGLRTGILGGSGTYTVVIIPTGGSTGSAQVTLWNDVSGTLALGAVNAVAIAYPNQQLRMSFAGTAGQNLGLDLSDIVGFTSGTIQVIGPGFNQTGVTTFTTAAGIGLRTGSLGANGTYTVIIVPASSATGTFNLRLWSDVTDTLTINSPYPLNIAYRNQQARLPFNGTVGQNLSIDLSGVTLPSGGTVQVMGPNFNQTGAVTFTTAGIAFNTGSLGATGVYTLLIVPSVSGIGSVTVLVSGP